MTIIDQTILTEKLAELARFIAELESVLCVDYDTFRADVRNVRTAERDLELLVEYATDAVGLLFISHEMPPSRSYRDAFDRVREMLGLSEEVASVLIELASLRNRLVHEYGQVYDERLAYMALVKAPDTFRAFATAVLTALPNAQDD